MSLSKKFQLFLIILLCGCNSATLTPQKLTVFPQDCEVPISGQIGLILQGTIEPNSQVIWEANLGSIINNSQGFGALYTAPSISGEAIITATISSGVGSPPITLTSTCKIFDPASSTQTPNPFNQPTLATEQAFTIVISEVMGNPCGDIEQRKYNQYIELYNYGTQNVDVNGWWIYDEGYNGTPDQIVTWQSRSPYVFGNGLIYNSTVIPPEGVAVILSPIYLQNIELTRTPYQFPEGTIMLTVAASETLGDDFFGIIADQNGYDTVTLYIGGAAVIERVIDTYGTPVIVSAYPFEIQDDFKDNIPNYLSDCYSIERINPRLPDSESNWKPILNGSPGEFPDK